MLSQSRCLIPLLLTALFSAVAGAQTVTAAVSAPQDLVTATRDATAPRLDARSVCPGLDAELQDSLARTWYLIQQPSLIRVQMQVEGGRVVDVRTSGGERVYSTPVKHAVRQLNCAGAGAGRHSVAFQVSFADSDDRRLP